MLKKAIIFFFINNYYSLEVNISYIVCNGPKPVKYNYKKKSQILKINFLYNDIFLKRKSNILSLLGLYGFICIIAMDKIIKPLPNNQHNIEIQDPLQSINKQLFIDNDKIMENKPLPSNQNNIDIEIPFQEFKINDINQPTLLSRPPIVVNQTINDKKPLIINVNDGINKLIIDLWNNPLLNEIIKPDYNLQLINQLINGDLDKNNENTINALNPLKLNQIFKNIIIDFIWDTNILSLVPSKNDIIMEKILFIIDQINILGQQHVNQHNQIKKSKLISEIIIELFILSSVNINSANIFFIIMPKYIEDFITINELSSLYEETNDNYYFTIINIHHQKFLMFLYKICFLINKDCKKEILDKIKQLIKFLDVKFLLFNKYNGCNKLYVLNSLCHMKNLFIDYEDIHLLLDNKIKEIYKICDNDLDPYMEDLSVQSIRSINKKKQYYDEYDEVLLHRFSIVLFIIYIKTNDHNITPKPLNLIKDFINTIDIYLILNFEHQLDLMTLIMAIWKKNLFNIIDNKFPFKILSFRFLDRDKAAIFSSIIGEYYKNIIDNLSVSHYFFKENRYILYDIYIDIQRIVNMQRDFDENICYHYQWIISLIISLIKIKNLTLEEKLIQKKFFNKLMKLLIYGIVWIKHCCNKIVFENIIHQLQSLLISIDWSLFYKEKNDNYILGDIHLCFSLFYNDKIPIFNFKNSFYFLGGFLYIYNLSQPIMAIESKKPMIIEILQKIKELFDYLNNKDLWQYVNYGDYFWIAACTSNIITIKPSKILETDNDHSKLSHNQDLKLNIFNELMTILNNPNLIKTFTKEEKLDFKEKFFSQLNKDLLNDQEQLLSNQLISLENLFME